jgi:hypothetical protein
VARRRPRRGAPGVGGSGSSEQDGAVDELLDGRAVTKHDPTLGPGSFGNAGPTCLGLADPDTGVAFCWVANQLGDLAGDPRPTRLIGAVRSVVGA